jgi:hypothetical protein
MFFQAVFRRILANLDFAMAASQMMKDESHKKI